MTHDDYFEEAAYNLAQAIKKCLQSQPIDPYQEVWELAFDAISAAYYEGKKSGQSADTEASNAR